MLNWNEVVGDSTVENGGYVGDLMKVSRAHIDDALDKNRLTQEEAGAAYANIIEQSIQVGIKYAIDEEQIRLSKMPSTLK